MPGDRDFQTATSAKLRERLQYCADRSLGFLERSRPASESGHVAAQCSARTISATSVGPSLPNAEPHSSESDPAAVKTATPPVGSATPVPSPTPDVLPSLSPTPLPPLSVAPLRPESVDPVEDVEHVRPDPERAGLAFELPATFSPHAQGQAAASIASVAAQSTASVASVSGVNVASVQSSVSAASVASDPVANAAAAPAPSPTPDVLPSLSPNFLPPLSIAPLRSESVDSAGDVEPVSDSERAGLALDLSQSTREFSAASIASVAAQSTASVASVSGVNAASVQSSVSAASVASESDPVANAAAAAFDNSVAPVASASAASVANVQNAANSIPELDSVSGHGSQPPAVKRARPKVPTKVPTVTSGLDLHRLLTTRPGSKPVVPSTAPAASATRKRPLPQSIKPLASGSSAGPGPSIDRSRKHDEPDVATAEGSGKGSSKPGSSTGNKRKKTTFVDSAWITFSEVKPTTRVGGRLVQLPMAKPARGWGMLSGLPIAAQNKIIKLVLRANVELQGNFNFVLPRADDAGVARMQRLAPMIPLAVLEPFLGDSAPDWSALRPIEGTAMNLALARKEQTTAEFYIYIIELWVKGRSEADRLFASLSSTPSQLAAQAKGLGTALSQFLAGIEAFKTAGGWEGKDDDDWFRVLSYSGWSEGRKWSLSTDRAYDPRPFAHIIRPESSKSTEPKNRPSFIQFLLALVADVKSTNARLRLTVNFVGSGLDVENVDQLSKVRLSEAEAFLSTIRMTPVAFGGANLAACGLGAQAGLVKYLGRLPPTATVEKVLELASDDIPVSVIQHMQRAGGPKDVAVTVADHAARRAAREASDKSNHSNENGITRHDVKIPWSAASTTDSMGVVDSLAALRQDLVERLAAPPRGLTPSQQSQLDARPVAKHVVTPFAHESFYPALVARVNKTRFAARQDVEGSQETVVSRTSIREGVTFHLYATDFRYKTGGQCCARLLLCVGQDVEYIEMLVTLSDRLPSSQSMSVEAYWNDELGELIVSHVPGGEPVLLSNAANNQYSHGSEPWNWDARTLVQRVSIKWGPTANPDRAAALIKRILAAQA